MKAASNFSLRSLKTPSAEALRTNVIKNQADTALLMKTNGILIIPAKT
jgi:hypothetical protein